MRATTSILALALALVLGACGSKGEAPKGEPAAALKGAGWDGGEGFDPTKPGENARVIAFFHPG
ncbi:MAG: hypothetical protein QNJ90_16770 [Planctomycetota bacterium]|nr:hypothetical protein [Planctomycetota bacterium]